MTPTAMVLGGTGFLGGHICAALRAAGHRVVSVSRGRPLREPGDEDVRHVHCDLTGAAGEMEALLADVAPTVVVNAAGAVWQPDEDRMWSLNAHLARRVARASAALPGPPRLVQLGSSHEYGAAAPRSSTAEEALCEPVSVYGQTKLSGTEAVLRTARETGLTAVVLRVANATGPGVPAGSLLGTVAQRLATAAPRGEGAPAQLRLAPLRAWRDFVDARDVAACAVLAATAPAGEVTGRVINVARGEAVPVRHVVERLIALADVPVQLTERQPAPESGGDGPGEEARGLRADLTWQQLDISRARRLLGWRPAVDLDTSLADLLAAVRLPERERKRT